MARARRAHLELPASGLVELSTPHARLENVQLGFTHRATKACFHEPMVNRTYADMARHYRTAIVPARPYKPRDKAMASYCTSFGS